MSAKHFLIICFCFISAGFVNSERLYKFEIKALEPQRGSDVCLLEDLEIKTGGWDHLQCNSHEYELVVPERTYCHVYQEDLVLEFQCLEGVWKPSSGTDIQVRSRRWLGALFGLLTAVVYAVVVIYCTEKTGNYKCEQKEVEPKDLIPPKYTSSSCPPPEIRSEYIAGSKQMTVKVTWSDPVATDDEEVLSNEQTCCEYTKGSDFPGLPRAGRRHSVTYTAKDNYGLTDTCTFSFVVKYLTCQEPSIPAHGRKISCPDGYLYGGQCSFECDTGYRLTGSRTATCQNDGSWDSIPTCEKKLCDPPFSIVNGNLDCDDTSYSYDSDCAFVCDQGFRLDGPRKMTCQEDQTWSVQASHVKCVDNESPVIDCQSPQVFYADRGGFTTSVTWAEPTATDNVDTSPIIQQLTGPAQGALLTEGYHYVQYKTTDSEGNSHNSLSQCTITLEVKAVKCSTGPTDALDDSSFMNYTCSDTSFYNGVSCTLGCQLNLPLNGTNQMTCERNGTTDKGVWNWGSGPQPFCQVVECPPLDAPANGAYTTDSINARPLHIMFCQKGFDISSVTSSSGALFTGRLSCQDSGKWYPLDAFPDCIVSILPWLTLPAELYYDGNCNDAATQDLIKQQALQYLSGIQDDIDQSICPDPGTCKVENVVVVCGATSGRKRRETAPHIIDKRQTGYALVTWDIKVRFDQGNKTTQDAYLDFLGVIDQIKNTIQTEVNSGGFDISGFTLATDAFQTAAQPGLGCDSGYKRDSGTVVCKPCPAGTYLNATTENCEYCKVGEYMNHEGALSCDLCPQGYSTLVVGAKHVNQCIKLCAPGFYSSTTMEPCSACPLGTYQSGEGQTRCQACPSGTATNSTNSISPQNCQYFDISVGHISQRTLLASVSAGGASVLSASVWIKPHSEKSGGTVTLYLSDSSGDLLTLFVSDVIHTGLGSSNPVRTNKAVSVERWTHVIASVDLSSGTLQVTVDGDLVLDLTGIPLDSARTVGTLNVEVLSQSDGISLSGLSVYSRKFTSSEMTVLTQMCSATFGDQIFSLSDILDGLVSGIALVTPSSCDPVDECQPGPCGEHKCINQVAGFQCVCHGGMTGTLCDVAPDYCLGNQCLQGNCVPTNQTYTCSCLNGYTGVLCDKPPVNGGWTEWVEWSGCDVTCGGGKSNRTRLCTNPPPGYLGEDCTGEAREEQDCNTDTCPECAPLERKIGTRVTCVSNDVEDLLECNMTCVNGKLLPNGQRPFEKYWCGSSTNYEWLPIDKTPECVDAERPDIFGTQVSVTYDALVPNSDTTSLTDKVQNQLTGIPCVGQSKCNVTTYVTSDSKRRRRSSATTLTLQFSVTLTDTGDLALADYLNSGTVTSAMGELLDTLQAMKEVIEFIQNNTASIFNVQVNGVDYTIENNYTDIVATVTCAQGSAGADGLCAKCAAGTRQYEVLCVDCEPGTYQPLTGQTECLPCPDGYTTASYGTTDISECSVKASSQSKYDDDNDDDDEHGNSKIPTVTIVVVVISVTALLLSVAAITAVLWKKVIRRRFRREDTRGSFASLSMVRPDTPSAQYSNNARTSFDIRNIATPPPPVFEKHSDIDPPSYDSHGFEEKLPQVKLKY